MSFYDCLTTIWAEAKALCGKVSEYLVMLCKKDNA